MAAFAPPIGKAPKDKTATEMTASVTSVRYRNPDNGWSVLNVKDHDEKLCCVGLMTEQQPEGLEYEFTGAWGQDSKYGWQFQFTGCLPLRPTTIEGLKRFLSSGIARGVGEVIAGAVVDYFGEDTIKVLEEGNADVLCLVPKLGRTKAQALIDGWQETELHRGVTVELLAKGLSSTVARKVIEYFGHLGKDPLEGLAEDPYQLTRIWGVGFQVADTVARKFGIDLDDPKRLAAAVVYALTVACEREGHCYLPEGEVVKRVAKLCDVTEMEVRDFLVHDRELSKH